MNEMARTYLRQARSFASAGNPARSAELLERASVLVRDDVALERQINEELVSAYEQIGRASDAQRLRARLDRTPVPPGQPPSGRSSGPAVQVVVKKSFWDRAPVLAVLAIVAAGSLAWFFMRGTPGGSSADPVYTAESPALAQTQTPPAIEPVSALPANIPLPPPPTIPATVPTESAAAMTARPSRQLLGENVALLVVSVVYANQYERWTFPISTGTAFAVTTDGLMLTNRHVVEPPVQANFPGALDAFGRPTVTWRGLSYTVCFSKDDRVEALLVYTSDDHDMAILKADRRFDRPLKISFDPPTQGEDALACGFPGIVQYLFDKQELTPSRVDEHIRRYLASGRMDFTDFFSADSFRSTLTRGIVSQSERNIAGSAYVQTDASVSEGNSGGPLLNSRHEVIGIVTLKVAAGTGNYNFALRMDQLRDELQNNGVHQ